MNDRRKVLVCVDGSENSLRAVEFARDLLVSVDGCVTLLVVVTPMDCDYFMEKTAPVCDVEAIAKAKSRAAASLLKESGVEHCLSVLTGNPAEAILKMSGKHHLVIMGRKGSGSSPAISLGGVSGQVSQNIKVPLLLVP
ncbi:MAG TPA: universal stress protein [Methanomassiliicoccales archaeon]|jgi:nucleotide-binding universal stress UspA family protein|nr:universal stress protein [Methanomassiliicoccales archaeon]